MYASEYWNDRYVREDTPWDTGKPVPPLHRIISGLNQRDIRILIPGAGRGYEAILLRSMGFQNVYVCDWAEQALDALRQMDMDFPEDHLLCGDFFALELQVDLILEHTFFCAIPRSMRIPYVQKAHQLLNSGGAIAGLLFSREFEAPGPPFGGSEEEYRSLFSPHFAIRELTPALDSIAPRLGSELQFRFEKRGV
jgi:hypothetical protein